jgi:hypothetical protein
MSANRQIYRSDAVARYVAARQETILPRMVRPRTIGYLWAGLLLLMIVSLGAWWTEIPSYQAGLGTIIVPTDASTSTQVVAFFPAERQPVLTIGEALIVTMPSGERLILHIQEVSDTPLSPAVVRARYGAHVDSNTVRVPVLVATASVDPALLATPGTRWAGSILPVEAQTGTYRLISIIPVIGAWFQ